MKRFSLFFAFLLVLSACKEKNTQIKTGMPTEGDSEIKGMVESVPEITLPSLEMVMGHFNPSLDSNFVIIDPQYTDKTGIFLQKEAYDKFIEMHNAAKLEGIDLRILSATRPFDYQRNIWERKWSQHLEQGKTNETEIVLEILKYSAMPGTSRHHWGTDIDLNYLNNHSFESGNGKAIYSWLKENASKYGYCQPYTAKDNTRPKGYEEEKWHWSYMPIAELYYQSAAENLKNSSITGFSGADEASNANVVEHYVLGVHPHCQ